MRTAAAWAVVLPVIAWAIVRLLGLERGYPLVPLMAFTPYAAAASVAATLVALALRRWAPAAAGAVSAVVLLAVVVPRVAGGDGANTSGEPLRVLTANVLYGRTPPDDLVAMARRARADVVSVQELTRELDRELRRSFPHAVTRTSRSGAEGTGLYSRLPLERVTPPETTALTTVADVRTPGGRRVRVVAVHSVPPIRGRVDGWRDDLRALPRAGRATILAGDFNATLDHRELRRLLDSGYADAAAEAGRGLSPTWPAGRRIPPEVTIDHVLASEGLGVRAARVIDLPRSDHRAVLAGLVVP